MDASTLELMLLQINMILLAAAVVIELIIAIYLSRIFTHITSSGGPAAIRLPPEESKKAAEQGYRPGPSNLASSVPASYHVVHDTVPQVPRSIEILEDRSDMMKNMQALAEKYYLDSITLATTDGLVVASSGSNAQTDAAQYSHMYKKGETLDDPKVQLFGLNHQGSSLIGIIKKKQSIPDYWAKMIEDDTKKILNWWL
jgi:hypothetical protein